MKKKLTSLLLALAMVSSLAACGNSDSGSDSGSDTSTGSQSTTSSTSASTSTSSADPITLRIGYMPNYASLWGVLSAMHTGAFEEEGITVELWEFADGPSEVAAMEGGSIDLAYIGKGAHTLCIQGRALVFAPSSVHTSDKIVVTAESGIESIEDLAGKRIAYNSGSSSESTLQSALSQAGLTEDDVELFDMDVSYMVSAMVSGTVDVAVAWNPYTTEILNQVEGAKEIEFSNGSINLSSWICLPDYAEENHDILVRFSQAILKAQVYRAANIDEVAETLASDLEAPVDTMLLATGEGNWQGAVDCMGDFDTIRSLYEAQQQVFLNNGTITEEVPVDNYVLFDVMQAAYEAYSANS